jgi:hypothetical protein
MMEQALRKGQAREWDRMMRYDVGLMRVKDRQEDLEVALLVMYNDEISDQEWTRRLETLQAQAVARALTVRSDETLRRADWDMNGMPDEEFDQMRADSRKHVRG